MLPRPFRSASFRPGPQMKQLARGMAAYGSAEMAGRVIRLATTIVIARHLTPTIVGEAALALTVFELVRVLERVGTGQQIVIAEERDLPSVCHTVRQVYWVWTLLLMVLQAGIAFVLAHYFGHGVAGTMLAALCPVFLFMAGGHVSYFLAMRAGKVGALARVNAVQTISDQLLTMVLMLLFPGPWAIVLPKVLVAPIWLIASLRAHPYHAEPGVRGMPLRQILGSSGSILAADVLSALRTQGDNLIVATMLGTTMLGTYYFAFNAGLGIVSSLVGAFGSVAFPMLARSETFDARRAALGKLGIGAAAIFGPLVLIQSLAAPYYVPIIFGARWTEAASLVSVMCLGGLTLAANQLVSAWLRANGQMAKDAANSLLNCAATLGGLTCGALFGNLMMAAAGLVGGSFLATAWILARHALPLIARRTGPPPAPAISSCPTFQSAPDRKATDPAMAAFPAQDPAPARP
ncbi:oligosaccharide flippase family protein [Novosphingobium nitrogenifigens]|nr:oligosaccharide flippase family protein [Novosphingobium nitrogenifigens]